jgi:Heterokaryon incompatibility protein (HET)
MPGYPIQRLRERENKPWSYESVHFTTGQLRLITVRDLLDTDGSTIILSEWRGLDLTREGEHIPKYATISHSWAPSEEVQRLSEAANRPLRIDLGGNKHHEVSWQGLVEAAKAAHHLGCDFVWLDLVSVHQDSSEDKKLQIQHMGQVYEKSIAVIVMPGGVAAAQGPEFYAPWITRAWTLQEATLSPSNVHVLIRASRRDPNYDYEIASTGPKYDVRNVDDEIALSKLQDLLGCRKRGLKITKVDKATKERSEVKFVVKCFGDDESLITALEGVLSGHTEAMKKSAAWRSIWLRTSTKPQDMVFSVMHLLGVSIKVDYNRTREDLILELARKTKEFPSWLDIGEDMPYDARFGLVPAIPIFHPNDTPSYNITGQLVPANELTEKGTYIEEYDIKIQTSTSATFEGDRICAKIILIHDPNTTHASIFSQSGDKHIFKDLDHVTGSHVVVLGDARVYGLAHLGLFQYGGPQVMFVGKSEQGEWERIGMRTTIPQSFVDNASRWHLTIGGPPGSQFTPCNC